MKAGFLTNRKYCDLVEIILISLSLSLLLCQLERFAVERKGDVQLFMKGLSIDY